jgi:hypothetical protein
MRSQCFGWYAFVQMGLVVSPFSLLVFWIIISLNLPLFTAIYLMMVAVWFESVILLKNIFLLTVVLFFIFCRGNLAWWPHSFCAIYLLVGSIIKSEVVDRWRNYFSTKLVFCSSYPSIVVVIWLNSWARYLEVGIWVYFYVWALICRCYLWWL